MSDVSRKPWEATSLGTTPPNCKRFLGQKSDRKAHMSYKRRNINLDKLSSYVRKTGICTEETALHLMDEIMFLRADNNVKQVIIDNYNLDMLMDIFKSKLEEEIVVTLQTGIRRGMLESATMVENLPGNHCKWIADDIRKLAESA